MSRHEIITPLLGIFYRRPSPDAAMYVDVGSEIAADTVVGLVEVMKQFTPVEAETAGKVVEILVEDGDTVEAGQVLMYVEA
jgi:biotin carboxyl carrier protein